MVYDAHQEEYQVYYKNWFFWNFDSCYKFDKRDEKGYMDRAVYYCDKETACQRAIDRAQAMLDTVEVWKKTNILGW